MRVSRYLKRLITTGLFCLVAGIAAAQDDDAPPPPPPLEVLISVADQELVLLRDGGVIAKYPVSTSRFGMGDSWGSYKTPLGKLRVYDKIGEDLSPGAVIKHRSATGEVLAPNAPGRDPIVTRVIWLEGTEEQNANARARGIYIHGTPMENTIGRPVSWGCIRMRSEDVIALYNQIPLGTEVDIVADKLPHLHKYKPPKPPEQDDGEQPSLTGLLVKLLPWENGKQSPASPPAPQATEKTQPGDEAASEKSAPGEKKPAAAPNKPAVVANKPEPVATKPEPVTNKPEPVTEKPVPVKIASPSQSHPGPLHVAGVVFHEQNGVETPKASHNSDAWRALQGSILSAGLPPPEPKDTAATAQTTQTQN